MHIVNAQLKLLICPKARESFIYGHLKGSKQNISNVLNSIAYNTVMIIISAITAAAPEMKSQSHLVPY